MIKTWDIFDTLIARRCISPENIFQIVEQVSQTQGFVQARIIAERNASRSGNYNLDDIYEEFQLLTGAPKDLCNALKKLECDVEFEQSIPITENIRQVKSGDVLISDMYLPENFIRQLLKKAGLLVPVEIFITSGGKSSGRIWQQFSAQNEFLFHTGDNPDVDAKNPRLVGFESAISILSKPIPIEQYILQHDFNFGAYLREIRLRNPFPEEIKRLYWQLFTLNIGILILLVQQIDALQKKYGFEYLGFCGRDTYYLRLLYEKYKLERGEVPTPNDYLYYSRKLVRYSGDELAKYFSAKINNRNALIIDLVGSGAHLHTMRERFRLNFSLLICLLNGKDSGKKFYNNIPSVENWTSFLDKKISIPENGLSIFIVEFTENFNVNDSIEALNRATHNSPVRLKALQVDGKILPKVTFSASNDTENFDVLESCLREVLNSKLVSSSYASGEGMELLLPLLKFINSYFIQIPLRNHHQLNEYIDSNIFKIFSGIGASK